MLSGSVFAADLAVDMMNHYAKELIGTPRSSTYTTALGNTVRSVTVPGYPQYRAGSITQRNGTISNFVEYQESPTKTVTEFRDQSGNVTTRTCESGTCTGDAPA